MAKAKEAMTTYYIERTGNRAAKVTVPSKWKVTFGMLNPGSKSGGERQPLALRFYESANQQRMVITQVESFRDMSIGIEEKRVSVKQQTFYRDTDKGKKGVQAEARVEEWVNPDQPQDAPEEFYSLRHEPEQQAETNHTGAAGTIRGLGEI